MSHNSRHASNLPNGINPPAEITSAPDTIPSPPNPPTEHGTKRRLPSHLHLSSHGLPKRRRTAKPPKPNLRLFTRDFKFALPLAPTQRERLKPGPPADDETTAALARCVDLALRLLEEGRGNRVLVGIGKQIVAERRAEAARSRDGRPAAGIYEGDLRDMPVWVAVFLRQVRELGIPICVCSSLSGYGLTQRWAWGSRMEDYDCRNSAVVYIHQCVSGTKIRSLLHPPNPAGSNRTRSWLTAS